MTFVIFFLLLLVLLYAHRKSRREIAELRGDLERLDARVSALGLEPEPEPAPAPAPPLEPTWARAPVDAKVEAEVRRQPALPAPAARAAPAAPPPAPSPPPPAAFDERVDLAVAWVKKRIEGVGWTVLVGVIVLFFGVAFLVKYAIDRDLVSVQLRLFSAAVAGVAMVAFGYRTRAERPLFGLSLQGGGMGVLYLTVFAAFRIYDLVPASLTFALLVAFVAFSSALAVAQDSRVLMILASTGGFLAPVLTSTGSGDHVALFSYYLVLNAGILAIAWFRAWRLLNLVGFGFTFAVSSYWGVLRYQSELFATTEPFLLAFFAMYVAVSVLFALRQTPDLKGLVDGTLVFGVPLAASVLQTPLVRDFEFGLAWSAAGFALFYLVLSRLVLRLGGSELRPLSETFLASGVAFGTLAIPFAFDEVTSAALWALEGAAIVWVGVRQNRPLARLFACALQILAGLLFLSDPGPTPTHVLVNATFFGTVFVALAGLITAFQLERARQRVQEMERALHLHLLFLFWGLAWWLGGCVNEVAAFATAEDQLAWLLIVFAATASLVSLFGRSLAWRNLSRTAFGLLPGATIVLLASTVEFSHPFEGLAALGWLAVAASHGLVLTLHRERDGSPTVRFWHAGGIWLGTLLAAWEVSYRVNQYVAEPGTWSLITWGWVPALVVLAITRFVRHETYETLGAMPIAAAALLWLVGANAFSAGDPAPLVYVPLLNPLDIVTAIVLATSILAYARGRVWLSERGVTELQVHRLLASLGFFWPHGIVVRTVHHWADVPFHVETLFASTLVQTSVAVLWAVTGLLCMVAGTRRGIRPVWVVGASLMGAVVVKLFLVDLSHTETVARIVSFLAVGSLLLVVGYLSPAPPAAES